MLLFFFVFLVTSFLHILDHAKVMNLLLKWCLSFYNGFDFSICFKKLKNKVINRAETKQNRFLAWINNTFILSSLSQNTISQNNNNNNNNNNKNLPSKRKITAFPIHQSSPIVFKRFHLFTLSFRVVVEWNFC